jgi:alcohol dehydrogenase class IV
MSASPYQRACSGIDALAQAIESMWAVGADDRSRGMAASAIDVLLPNLVPFVEAPDATNADAMATGSQLAGQAIHISRTTVPHALSYAITQTTGLPHGHAVSHTLPAVFDRHLRGVAALAPGISPRRHERTMQWLVQTLGHGDAAAAVGHLEGIVRRVGLREPASSCHAMIAHHSRHIAGSIDPSRSGNNPVVFTPEELREILAGTSE